ncbi:DUF5319 family protein [Rhodococcus sp. ARP2]|uniref:DUF5319 family protein n=1 Tax=Rhodococcus sp. ARP2 TaxID=1661385 RepID=UPI00069D67B9|nr:DUF5319 family protein [Rhodococcus sp. ARP2]
MPLGKEDVQSIRADLADLTLFEAMLKQKGIDGLIIACDDCNEDHRNSWADLIGNMIRLLAGETIAPGHGSSDGTYVTWDWCRGYAAAYSSDVPRYTS